MSSDSFQTVHPATGEVIHVYKYLSSLEIETAIESAWQKFHVFKTKPVQVKSDQLRALARELRKESEALGRLITLEMGKVLKDSQAEIEKCAVACEYFADNLEKFRAAEEVKSGYQKSLIVKEGIGPVLAIMPWNFPIWQTIRFAAPAVGIGNPILLKHSVITAGTAEKLEEIFNRVEKGLLTNLRINHEQAAHVIADKRVRGVTLTGSTRAGREIATTAGKHLKKAVLELGGSDAYIVFSDVNIEKAAKVCAAARMVNNGQSCIAAKRFLVEKSIYPQFIKAFEIEFQKFSWGDPFLPESQVGSLAAKAFQKQLLEQCQTLEKKGAQKIFDCGKDFDFERGHSFFPPRAYKVSGDLDQAFQDEFFGPVALVFEFESEVEAIGLANKSPYGLGGALFTEDLKKACRLSRELEAGFLAINEQVKSDARLPFGGVKDSGYGRELSLYGFNEFCNIKTIGFAGDPSALSWGLE